MIFGGARISLLAVVLAVPVSGVACAADSYLPNNLDKSDMAVMQDAAKQMPRPPAASGARTAWSNPRTGHSGTVVFIKDLRKQDMACKLFRYTFHTGAATDGNPYMLTWCRTPQGDWSIVN